MGRYKTNVLTIGMRVRVELGEESRAFLGIGACGDLRGTVVEFGSTTHLIEFDQFLGVPARLADRESTHRRWIYFLCVHELSLLELLAEAAQ